jgi:hypothetical protein
MFIVKHWVLVTVALAAVVGTLFTWQVWQTLILNGYMSCLASVESELEGRLKSGELSHSRLNNQHWNFLAESDAADLLGQIKGYDCLPTHDASVDVWGNKIKIALRDANDRLGV